MVSNLREEDLFRWALILWNGGVVNIPEQGRFGDAIDSVGIRHDDVTARYYYRFGRDKAPVKPQHLTMLFIFVIAVIIVGYDLFALVKWGRDATITAVMEQVVEDYPKLALVASFALGAAYVHLFLSERNR